MATSTGRQWLAPSAFGAYLFAALSLGECYPLSQYPMYSVSGYERGGVLVLRADGQELRDVRTLLAVADISPDALRYPDGMGFSTEYRLDELRHYIATHSPQEGMSGEPVRLEIGLRIAVASENGPSVVEPFFPLAEGVAWLRD